MSTDLVWFKSSFSGSEGECVEVALRWSKSSRSDGEGECVEIALTPTTIHIRDSKTPTTPATPTVQVTPTTWTTFLNSLS
ncbi:DUF397 domain-containing protein [Streptomyces sp. NBC_00444]|uniref:DUF397 domain-containing protein n=1 Tax=Streptomyces sp. NBC_00444 TaxID=2975744 RepID=UPI002E1AC4EF